MYVTSFGDVCYDDFYLEIYMYSAQKDNADRGFKTKIRK